MVVRASVKASGSNNQESELIDGTGQQLNGGIHCFQIAIPTLPVFYFAIERRFVSICECDKCALLWVEHSAGLSIVACFSILVFRSS